MIKVILGVICAMASLWLGCYVLWELKGYWYTFPAFITVMLGFIGGALYTMLQILDLYDKSKEAGKSYNKSCVILT